MMELTISNLVKSYENGSMSRRQLIQALALMAGAARRLPTTGVLVLYGPYRREERRTAPSNEAFDRQLRSSNPDWGVRDLEAVSEAAASHCLALQDVTTMPSNNFCVVFRPAAGAP